MGRGRTGIALAAVAAAAALPCAQPAPVLAATALYMGATFNELSVPQESPEFIGFYIGAMEFWILDESERGNSAYCLNGYDGVELEACAELDGSNTWRWIYRTN